MQTVLSRHMYRAAHAATRYAPGTPEHDAACAAAACAAADCAGMHLSLDWEAQCRARKPAAPGGSYPPLPALTEATRRSLISTAVLHRENMLRGGGPGIDDNEPLQKWARRWQITTRYLEALCR